MRIEKNGPTTPVTVGQAFTFTVRANFDQAGPFTAAKIVDDLPVGLLPGATAATWTARNNNQQLSGSKQLQQQQQKQQQQIRMLLQRCS
jgi:hypothetical protein